MGAKVCFESSCPLAPYRTDQKNKYARTGEPHSSTGSTAQPRAPRPPPPVVCARRSWSLVRVVVLCRALCLQYCVIVISEIYQSVLVLWQSEYFIVLVSVQSQHFKRDSGWRRPDKHGRRRAQVAFHVFNLITTGLF